MNVRWNAVLLGIAVDFSLTFVLQSLMIIFGITQPFQQPDLGRTPDLVVLGLGLLAPAAGGYVAGWSANESRAFNGFMVGIVAILLLALLNFGSQQGSGQHILAFSQLLGCITGALGGYLSRFRLRSAG